MIIHSKFKDYYDGMSYVGYDDTVHYPRETVEIDATALIKEGIVLPFAVSFYFRDETYKGYSKRWDRGQCQHISKDGFTFKFDDVVVVVAGKVHRGVWMHSEDSLGNTIYENYFWSSQKLEEQLSKFGKESIRRHWMMEKAMIHHMDMWNSEDPHPSLMTWMIENKIVSLVKIPQHFKVDQWYVDYPLVNVQFYKCMDMNQVWQEIEMWVSGPLSQKGSPPLVTLSDESLRAKHGLDKWSFRKKPNGHA